MFDYTYLLKAAQRTGVNYIVMLEDDVLALDGWYHRTLNAAALAEQQTRSMGAEKCMYTNPAVPIDACSN